MEKIYRVVLLDEPGRVVKVRMPAIKWGRWRKFWARVLLHLELEEVSNEKT